ncbi:TLP18.3, Psb32 and MOLO-1 founding protein of phosphatase [Mesonia phycicola]|uniref:TLP18.3, Psb32 and MOLO-1 founding protein of phosphatase n=1 Tax=Mesonia phycicola TaxID=579105 RepID=A0A1M6G116_9FLAO|nr:TPM domain-containing protein [Mesonia phycicola]SHJ03597.1 TLP18.3, Psb32 and MOLO-1 founding protein of phosphatase [Mesonia phycicola]
MSNPNNFISHLEEEEVIEAIKTSEKNTSGEIRVHIESRCTKDILERAKEVFYELKMDQTKLKNGVLIYLAIDDHKFYIMGDQGINDVVADDFWQSTKDVMQAHFRKGNFKQGLVDGILKAGDQLKYHFPWASDDVNELSDEISRG